MKAAIAASQSQSCQTECVVLARVIAGLGRNKKTSTTVSSQVVVLTSLEPISQDLMGEKVKAEIALYAHALCATEHGHGCLRQ